MPGTTRKKTKTKRPAKARSKRTPPKRKVEAAAPTPDLESRIRERAYHLYLNRGGAPGEDLNDWLQAERELSR